MNRPGPAAAVVVVVVVVHALAQALLVLGDPVPVPTAGFLVRTVLSALALLAATVVVTLLVSGGRRPWRVLGAAAGLLVVAIAATVVSTALSAAVVLAGAVLLPAAATGRAPRLPSRAHRLAAAAGGVAVATVLVLCWGVALLAGVLLAPVWAAGVTWLVTGLAAAAVLGAVARPARPGLRSRPGPHASTSGPRAERHGATRSRPASRP